MFTMLFKGLMMFSGDNISVEVFEIVRFNHAKIYYLSNVACDSGEDSNRRSCVKS